VFSSIFWKQATERALKTLAQFIITLGAAGAFNVLDIDLRTTLGLALGGMLLSYATSVLSAEISKTKTPDLVDGEQK